MKVLYTGILGYGIYFLNKVYLSGFFIHLVMGGIYTQGMKGESSTCRYGGGGGRWGDCFRYK